MKNIVSFIGLFALLVSGCSHEEVLRNGTSGSNDRTFTASFERNESRTYLENGYLSCWTAGDCISLFEGNTLNCEYMFDGGTGENEGTFSMVNKLDGNGLELAANYAVYPYDSDVKVSERGVIAATLPSEQHYAEKSFGLGDNTMVAVTDDTEDTFLSFKNVGGFLKFQLYGDDVTIKSITLIGNNGEKIAGKAAITVVHGEAPVVKMEDDATTSITLDCGEEGVKVGSSVEAATSFWMVLPSVTFGKGITIMVRDVNGGMFTQTTSKELVIERNVVKPMKAVNVEPEAPKLAYSTNQEELEGWAEGLFGGEGTYMMGKAHGDNGYLMTIGNILEKESAIVFMDESKQVREIFVDNTIITLGDNSDGGVDVSIIEKGNEEKMEQIVLSGEILQSRSSGDHSQQVGVMNLAQNLQGMYDAVKEIGNAKGFSKKGVVMFLVNKADAIRNTVKTLGGPDIFDETFSTWLGNSMNGVSLAELAAVYGTATVGGAAGACALAYLNLYSTYLEQYDKHIETYYGNSIIEIEDVKYEDNGLKLNVNVSGYESWYDVECGVIVQQNSFPAPRYSSGLVTTEVTQDGNYIFIEDVQQDATYYCRPFLIAKERTSLWKGFIGDMVGPLVRYGKTVKYEPDSLREALIKLYQSTNGDNWTHNDNWCSDLPVTEWYGIVYNKKYDRYHLNLDNNNLTGEISQTFPADVKIYLSCGYNKLSSIDVSGCTALTRLSCSNNPLTSLDITDCTALTHLYCANNQLTSLDTSGCAALYWIFCEYNSLAFVNVSGCTALNNLICHNNQLTTLDVSGCSALDNIGCSNNQLTSLDVSDCTALTHLSCSNNQLTSLDVSGCVALYYLDCNSNQLTSLDVSKCIALYELNCKCNQLTLLNVSGCTSLEILDCQENQLSLLDASNCTSLDVIRFPNPCQITTVDLSNCTSLKDLDFRENSIISNLDVSGCTALTDLYCYNNQLASLNVTGCTSLASLEILVTQLSSLDVSSCTSLTSLRISKNQLKSFNVAGCTSLTSLYISNEQLSSLDVSGCTALTDLYCYNNQLTSIKVSGCTALTRLDCNNDNQLTFLDLTGCTTLKTLFCENNNQLTSLDVSGCTALTNLYCYNNQLTSLNVSGCTALTGLSCYNNQLTSLNVSGCTALTGLICYNNQLTSLNVSGCKTLISLYCYNNQLTMLNVSDCTSLKELRCKNNKINSEIPAWFSQMTTFKYDIRYEYEKEYDEDSNSYVVKHKDNGVGWWYPGEPEKGRHSPE